MKAIPCPQVSFSFSSCKFVPYTFDTAPSHQTQVFHSITDVPFNIIKKWVSPETLAVMSGTESAKIPGMEFRYALFYREGIPAIFACFQIFSFSARQTGEYASSPEKADNFSGKVKNLLARIAKNIMEKRQIRLLVSGNVLLTGQPGYYCDPFVPENEGLSLLPTIINEILSNTPDIDAILLKDHLCLPETVSEEWQKQGFTPFETEPNMVLPIVWKSVNDYHLDMSSKYRQRVKSAYKKSDELLRRELNLSEVIRYKDRLFELFHSVLKEDRFNMVSHSPEYLPSLKTLLEDQFRVLGYFRGDDLVAFQTLILKKEEFDAHFLGYHCDLNHEYKLYQRMLYDAVAIAIEEGFNRISFGRTAMEIKSAVGAVPEYPVCYLKFTRPIVNRLAVPFLRNVKTEAWQPRHPFKPMILV
ncbi:MAG: GNAT family N-acetyltransferase [Bacteroidia bacterium]|nr:GNAT family N-acetyltransferase [Bacteroidia bacterium]